MSPLPPASEATRIAIVVVLALAIGLVVTAFVLFVSTLAFGYHQEVPVQQAPAEVLAEFRKLPPVKVELREVIEILSDYDVVHEGKLMTYLQYYGLTEPRTKTIYINSNVSQDYRSETVIHEIIHIIYSRRGYDTRGPFDAQVEEQAQAIYVELFGFAAPKPQSLSEVEHVK